MGYGVPFPLLATNHAARRPSTSPNLPHQPHQRTIPGLSWHVGEPARVVQASQSAAAEASSAPQDSRAAKMCRAQIAADMARM